MRTDDLIVKLAREAVPVTPVRSVARRVATWMAVAVAAAVVGIAVIGLRPDVGQQLQDPTYVLALAVTLALGVIAAAGALTLAIPDDRRTSLVLIAPLALAAAWGALLVGQLARRGDVVAQLVRDSPHAACFFQIALAALVPAVVLITSVRRAAPLDVFRTAALGALGALGVSAAAAQLTCPYDSPAHLFLWHFGTVVTLAAASVAWARPALARVVR